MIVLDANDAVTPEGKPVAEPILVVPVVVEVMVKGELTHITGVEEVTLAALPILIVKILSSLIQLLLVFIVKTPVYVPACVFAGIFNTIGLVIVTSISSKSKLGIDLSQTILYRFGAAPV